MSKKQIISKDALPKDSKIAVIGSGIAGCSVALSLHNRGFKNVIIYEKDQGFGERRQGYGLTIQQAVSCLIELDCFEQVKEVNTPTDYHLFFNKKGDVKGFFGRSSHDRAQKKFNVHVSRQDLRYVLMEQVEKQGIEIKWDKKLESVKETETQVLVKFQDSDQVCDLVIGCDGVFSNVRKMFIDQPLEYLGVIVVLGIVHVDHYLLDRVCFETSDGRTRLYCMPFSQKYKSSNDVVQTMWQLSFRLDLNVANELSKDKVKLKKYVCELMKDFHDPVPQMVNDTELDSLMATPVFHMDPVEMEKFHSQRVVLIGDALHPMSPFKSQGANRALIDSVTLGKQLSCLSVKDAFLQFHKETFRNAEKVMASRKRVDTLHNGDEIEFVHGEDEKIISVIKEHTLGSWSGKDLFKMMFPSHFTEVEKEKIETNQ